MGSLETPLNLIICWCSLIKHKATRFRARVRHVVGGTANRLDFSPSEHLPIRPVPDRQTPLQSYLFICILRVDRIFPFTALDRSNCCVRWRKSHGKKMSFFPPFRLDFSQQISTRRREGAAVELRRAKATVNVR